jgi:hypothetical protein
LTGDLNRLRVLLVRRLGHSSEGAKAARAFVGRMNDEWLDLTFDPAVATARKSIEFVSLHQPLIRLLAEDVALRRELSPCTAIRVDLPQLSDEPAAFFVFELRAHGVRDALELAAVVIDTTGAIVVAGDELLARLEDARDMSSVPSVPGDVLRRMHESALDWVVADVAVREQVLRAESDERLNTQVESLRLFTDRRRLWLREQIQESSAASIRRMREAQLRRLETEAEAKLARIEARRGVTVGYRLLAAGLVAAA